MKKTYAVWIVAAATAFTGCSLITKPMADGSGRYQADVRVGLAELPIVTAKVETGETTIVVDSQLGSELLKLAQDLVASGSGTISDVLEDLWGLLF